MANENLKPDAAEFDFAAFLADFGHGATNKLASAKLREIVQACAATGKKGALTIKIVCGSVGGLAELRAAITITKPEPALPGGAYYVTETGGLVTEDPKQLKLPARVLDIAPVKNIQP